uniref:Uncharacterized protein n=1 Tax=Octopus bimaculoides TaxID=37653 RepID=A0A0L8GGA7_OCTBM
MEIQEDMGRSIEDQSQNTEPYEGDDKGPRCSVLLYSRRLAHHNRIDILKPRSKNPDTKISFSKFAQIRPKECILADSAGTHNLCVCTIHQNVKLMISGMKLSDLSKDMKFHLIDYKQCLESITCSPTTNNCYMGNCSYCNSLLEELEKFLYEMFNVNVIDEVQYKQLLTTDTTILENISKSTNDFVEKFCQKLNALKVHNFIAKEQSKFCTSRKESLSEGETLVIADFSENYSFILQDANKAQATIHLFVCYYKQNNDMTNINVVIISDCVKHDTVAVHFFQKKNLIDFLRSKAFNINKIIYFSDVAASQYKIVKTLKLYVIIL